MNTPDNGIFTLDKCLKWAFQIKGIYLRYKISKTARPNGLVFVMDHILVLYLVCSNHFPGVKSPSYVLLVSLISSPFI